MEEPQLRSSELPLSQPSSSQPPSPQSKALVPYQHPEPIAFAILLALAGAVFGYALSCVLGGPTSDEGFHAPQVWHYYVGGKDHFDNITMPSTYHYALAFVVRQIGYYHDYLLRFIHMVVALGVLPIFYYAARRYPLSQPSLRTLQLFFAPLIFPYFFVLYTDLWALLFITLCFFFTLGRRTVLAAVAALCAVCIRQDSIIWVGLAYLLICSDGIAFRWPQPLKAGLRNAFVQGGPVLVVLLLFVAFVIYNGGVAIGDAGAHQITQFNINNLYVFLICAWLLFFALSIQQLPRVLKAMRRPWVPILLLIGFLLYMGTVSNPHGYNNTMFTFFMHNGLLYLMNEYVLIRAALYIPLAWMAMTLILMDYPDKRCYWLLLVIPLAVISHPLVEPRYYFPAYVLINLWRPAMPQHWEFATLSYYIVAAAFIMYGTVTGWFFL